MALSARAGDAGGMLLRRSMVVTLTGILAGVTAAVALTGVMGSLLYGVTPLDLPTFASVVVTLCAVAAIATWLPARRAARTDPLEALRFE